MAMIDYGAVVFKNGVQIHDEMFMDMEESVGWVDWPKSRYKDCDCLDEDGYADCGNCPKSEKKHMSDPELGEWDYVKADCRGKELHIDGKLDGNYFAFVGDEHLTFCFYKAYCTVVVDGNKVLDLCGADPDYHDRGHKSFRGTIGDDPHTGVSYHICVLSNRVAHFSMRYKGDDYHVVYGYGIDVNKEIWNKEKYRYLGKRLAKKVDRLYATIASQGSR